MMNRTRQWPTTPVLTVLFGRSPLSARCSRNCLFRYRRHPDRVRMDQAGAVFGAASTARHGPADTGGHDIPRALFAEILHLIDGLRPAPLPP
jgi:hypothetical protein